MQVKGNKSGRWRLGVSRKAVRFFEYILINVEEFIIGW
jgi:hypothetical protein